MKIGEAITRLISYIDNSDMEDLDALQTAISALRMKHTNVKKREWEGCYFCEIDCRNCYFERLGCLENPCKKCKDFSEFHFKSLGKYCRECGKPLTEEAWAELERRINGVSQSEKG